MTEYERDLLHRLESRVGQLENDRSRLQQQAAFAEQQIAQLQRNERAQASWATRVSKWIQEHVGGHTSAVTEEIDSWLKQQ